MLLAAAERAPEDRARLLAVGALLALLVAVLVVYPIANVHTPGQGSDGDDMLRQGAESLLHLRYPFDNLSYLGNPVSVLPGALFLAIPFTALGSVALANVFWAAGLVYVLQRRTRSTGLALASAGVVVGLSPEVWHQFATGTDRFSNGVYVLIPLVILLGATTRRASYGAAAALGVALSSRITVLAFLPVTFAFLVRHRGWQWAISRTAVAVGVFLALLIPFAIRDLDGFSPLLMASTNRYAAGALEGWLYHGIQAAGAALAVGLAFRHTATVEDVLRDCILIQVAAFGLVAVALSVQRNTLDAEYAAFAAMVLPFGAYLLASRFARDRQETETLVAGSG